MPRPEEDSVSQPQIARVLSSPCRLVIVVDFAVVVIGLRGLSLSRVANDPCPCPVAAVETNSAPPGFGCALLEMVWRPVERVDAVSKPCLADNNNSTLCRYHKKHPTTVAPIARTLLLDTTGDRAIREAAVNNTLTAGIRGQRYPAVAFADDPWLAHFKRPTEISGDHQRQQCVRSHQLLPTRNAAS